jgi:hypothetical protein
MRLPAAIRAAKNAARPNPSADVPGRLWLSQAARPPPLPACRERPGFARFWCKFRLKRPLRRRLAPLSRRADPLSPQAGRASSRAAPRAMTLPRKRGRVGRRPPQCRPELTRSRCGVITNRSKAGSSRVLADTQNADGIIARRIRPSLSTGAVCAMTVCPNRCQTQIGRATGDWKPMMARCRSFARNTSCRAAISTERDVARTIQTPSSCPSPTTSTHCWQTRYLLLRARLSAAASANQAAATHAIELLRLWERPRSRRI